MSRLGGLWRAMPWTAGTVRHRGDGRFRPAAVQRLRERVAGLPRTVRCRGRRGPAAWAAAVGGHRARRRPARWRWRASSRRGRWSSSGTPRTRPAAQAHEMRTWMRGPMLVTRGDLRRDRPAVTVSCGRRSIAPPACGIRRGPRPMSARDAHDARARTRRRWRSAHRGRGSALARGARQRHATQRSRGTAGTLRRPRGCNTPAALSRPSSPDGSPGSCSARRASAGRAGVLPSSAMRLERIPETVLERVDRAGGGCRHACVAWPRVGCSMADCRRTCCTSSSD